jgi:hypothetical protein
MKVTKHYPILLFLMLLRPLLSYSQELPATVEEFKYAFIHMSLPEEKEKTSEEKRQEQYLKNFNAYKENLNKELSMISAGAGADLSRDFKNHPDAQGLMDCVNNFADKGTLSSLSGTISQCQRHLNNMSKSEWDLLKEKGIKNPEEFRERMKNELEKLKTEVDAYNRPDEVVIITNYLEMDEVAEENLALIQGLDPAIIKLSTDVQAIIVDYYTSPNLKTFMLQRELSGESVGKEELIEFTQILDLIHSPSNECWTNGSMQKVEDLPLTVSGLKGKDKEHDKKDFGQFLLGIQSPKDFAKIDGYKFNDGENTYYFYHGKRSQLSEDVWVMAKINPEGEMSFRYYRFNESQDRKILLSKEADIKLLQSKLQQTTLTAGKNGKIYIQAQEGMIVEGDKTKIPIVGEMTIPKDKLVIGQVHMAYVTPKSLTQGTVSFDSQSMGVGAQTQPTHSTMWSAGAGIRFQPMNQNWQVNGNVRVMNLMLGYSDNLSGQRSGSVNYVIARNYMGVSSNLDNSYSMNAGRQFSSGQGGVSFSTNFNNIHEIKLVLFLDKSSKRP